MYTQLCIHNYTYFTQSSDIIIYTYIQVYIIVYNMGIYMWYVRCIHLYIAIAVWSLGNLVIQQLRSEASFDRQAAAQTNGEILLDLPSSKLT